MQNTISVVFINSNEEILVLKRGKHKKWYPTQRSIISGKIENNEDVDVCLKREIKEEIGIESFEIISEGNSFIYKENDLERNVFPFLCKIIDGEIALNEEHSEYMWVSKDKLLQMDCALPLEMELNYIFSMVSK